MKVIAYIDGGSRGNPGPAAAAFVLHDSQGHRLAARGIVLGKTTNNVAEYSALIHALETARSLGATDVSVFSDSELLVRQLTGLYKVKSESIRPLYEQVDDLRREFDCFSIRHVLREKNKEADRLVNQALDAGHDVEEKSGKGGSGKGEDLVGNSRSMGVPPVHRGMGILPMNHRQDADATRDHGQDARATHGRDAHATVTPRGVTTNEPGAAAGKSTPQKKLRLAVLISGGGRTMMNLLDAIQRGELNAEIVLVISSLSTVGGVEKARKAGLPVEVVRKKDYPDLDAFSDRLTKDLDAARVDLVVQGGWLCLWEIPPQYENRVMNIHPALLPSFGGKGMWGHHVHEAVLAAGCKISGCTVHFCTNEYDKGPIIVQRTCPVEDDDTPDSLAERVFQQECIAYPQAIRWFAEGRLSVEGNRVRVRQASPE